MNPAEFYNNVPLDQLGLDFERVVSSTSFSRYEILGSGIGTHSGSIRIAIYNGNSSGAKFSAPLQQPESKDNRSTVRVDNSFLSPLLKRAYVKRHRHRTSLRVQNAQLAPSPVLKKVSPMATRYGRAGLAQIKAMQANPSPNVQMSRQEIDVGLNELLPYDLVVLALVADNARELGHFMRTRVTNWAIEQIEIQRINALRPQRSPRAQSRANNGFAPLIAA